MSAAPIRITFRPGIVDHAWAEVDGRTFEASSGSGAIFALCRELVAAGLPDGPFEATPEGRAKATLTGPSFHRAARLTCNESRIIRYTAPKTGANESPVRPAA